MKPLFFLSLLLITPMLLLAQSSNGYCLNKGTRGNAWLQKVSIGNWSFNTGGNSGYLYQPDSKLVLNADTSYSIQLELGGYPRVQDSAYWRIWIDFNRDMDFEDEGEQVFQSKTVYKGSAKGTLNIPRLFEAEKYMMRLVVAKNKFSPACGESSVIEMEDYLTVINPAFPCNSPKADNILIEKISDNQAILSIKDLPALKYKWHIESEDASFIKDYTLEEASSIILEGLKEKTKYKVRLKIECAQGESRWSSEVNFTTLVKSICPAPRKQDILVEQLDRQSARLTLKGAERERIEWRYRIKGRENWSSWIGSDILTTSFPSGSDTLEVQVRSFCDGQNVWTNWSEVLFADVSQCLFPDEKNVYFYTSFFEYPNLRFRVHFAYTSYYKFRWYYREKGEQNWIDTLSITSNDGVIPHLTPGKTYEIRIDVLCGQKSLSLYKEVRVDPVCLDIGEGQLSIGEVYDSSAQIEIMLSGTRTLEFRYRKSGETEFKVTRFKDYMLKGLEPLTTYELGVRVVCEDSIPNWSPSVFFTTKGCNLPYTGTFSVVRSYLPDSILYRADFPKFSGSEGFQFYWKYKATNTKQWVNLDVKNENGVLFKNLKKSTKYDVQLILRCQQNPLDSFLMSTTFTALKDDCAQKPDPSAMTILNSKPYPNSTTIYLNKHRENAFEFRVKSVDSLSYNYYLNPWGGSFNVGFYRFPGVNDFQFRFACPSGNVSPWSDTIKIKPWSLFAPSNLPALAMEKEPNLVNTTKDLQLHIAPNPSSGHFHLELPTQSELEQPGVVEVFNLAGQKILSQKIGGYMTTMDLSNQTNGLYFVRVFAGKQTFCERILLQK